MKFDVVIYGGGTEACLRAAEFAHRGYRVALIEQRSFAGRDVTAVLRPWELCSVKPELKTEFEKYLGGKKIENAENREIKKFFYRWLSDAGVSVFFGLQACAVLTDGEKRSVSGILLGSKWGYFLAEAEYIIDAEPSVPLLRMLSGNIWRHGKTAAVSVYCGKCENRGNLPESIVLKDSKALIHDVGDDLYIEFVFTVKDDNSVGEICLMGHEIVFNGLKYLENKYPDCGLCPRQIAYEPFIETVPLTEYQPVQKLYTIFDADKIHDGFQKGEAGNYTEKMKFVNRNAEISFDECTECGCKDYEEKLPLKKMKIPYEAKLNRCGGYDVIVAGGGTAGVPAAAASRRCGANTLVIEMNNGLGGTQTYGYVSGYYHGYVNGFAAVQNENMQRYGLGNSWTGRLLWYNHLLRYEEAEVKCSACICGAVRNGNAVTGVVVISDGIWEIAEGRIVIDATGDGDIIKFAGIPCTLGSKDDGNLQDSSQWDLFGSKCDLDVIDQSQYSEIMRGIHMAHEMSSGKDFSVMLSVREGRTFCGEYTLDMRDIILRRHFEDTIAVAYTDNDPHGGMSATISLLGLTPYHENEIMVEIPYRSCVPKGIDGLLAASKSIGATQDAASYLRMAADVQNRGYAVGTAAGLAIKHNVGIREIPIKELQELMLHMQILPGGIYKKNDVSGMERLTELLKTDEADAMKQIICMPPETAVPKLQEILEERPNDISAAIALGWFGDKSGLKLIRDSFSRLVRQENIDSYDDKHPFKTGNNKGGIIGEITDYWRINQILTVLAVLKEPAETDDIVRLIEQFTSGGKPVRNETGYVCGRVDLQRIPHYDRIRCLAFYIKAMPSEVFCASIEALLEKDDMRGYVSESFCTDCGKRYQSVYLEELIYDCLARCGSPAGIDGLKACMRDIHFTIRRKAYRALETVEANKDRTAAENIDILY